MFCFFLISRVSGSLTFSFLYPSTRTIRRFLLLDPLNGYSYVTQQLQNLHTFQSLADLSIGMTFDYSDLTIELFSITRCLLQHTSTNVMTFDFEDGQYLYVTRADRDYTVYQVSSNQEVAPSVLHCITYIEWNINCDSRTRITQIPPNMAWSHRFT
jgi:hypothetical protein